MSILVIKARSAHGREQCVLDAAFPSVFTVGGGGDWQPCGAADAPLARLESDGLHWHLQRLRGALRVDGVTLTGVIILRAPAVVSLDKVSLLIDDALEPGISTLALDDILQRRAERERLSPAGPSGTVSAADFERLRAAPSSGARRAQAPTARALAVRPVPRRALGVERALLEAREENELTPVWQGPASSRQAKTTLPSLPKPPPLPRRSPRAADANELAALTQVVDSDTLRAEFAKRFEETLRNQRAAKLAARAPSPDSAPALAVATPLPVSSSKLPHEPRARGKLPIGRGLLMIAAVIISLCAIGAYKVVRGSNGPPVPPAPSRQALARDVPSVTEPPATSAPLRESAAPEASSVSPRQAADAFIRGEFERALTLYRALSTANPGDESYALFVNSIARRQATRGALKNER